MIHVTSFFRDTETFDYFKASLFPQLLTDPERTEPIRIWVAGCAGGEEVYSIAMVLHEALGEPAHHTRVQIFATDISEGNLLRARAGVYPESATSDIRPDRLHRYFHKTEGGYQVVKFLREWCVFARHDVIRDPPFSRLDVVSCRNMLIYLNAGLQKQVLTHFHYGLKPGGHLVVGKQEGVSAASELFSLVDRKANAFVRVAAPARIVAELRELEPEAIPKAEPSRGPAVFDLRNEAERVILDRYAPPGLVVDGALQIVHFQGDTSPFLRPVSGGASFSALKLVAPPLMLMIRGAVQEARRPGSRPAARTFVSNAAVTTR